MEGKRNGINNGSGSDPPHFIAELCKLANISTSRNNICVGVSENILETFRQRQNELVRYQGFLRSLCDILGVATYGQDISCQTFLDTFGEIVRQDLVLAEGIRNNFAERRPFGSETQPLSGNIHSNDHSFSSESSEIAPNGSNEVLEMNCAPEDVKAMPMASPILSMGSSGVQTPRPLPEVFSTTSAQRERASPAPPTLDFGPATDPAASVNDHDNWATKPPILSPNWPEEGHQTASDLGQTQSTNELAQVGTASDIDSMLSPPLPSTSRQLVSKRERKTKKDKRQKERVAKKKIHANQGLLEGFYRCTCGSKFKSKGAQVHHIKFFNAEWKFKCEEGCGKKFYNLSLLKAHLRTRHKKKSPLKDYTIGCTRCGIMFKTRSQFGKHQRKVHNIQNVTKPRRPYVTLRQHPKLSSSPDLKIEVVDIVDDDDTTQQVHRLVNQIEVIDLVSEDEGDNVDEGVSFWSVVLGNAPPPPLTTVGPTVSPWVHEWLPK